MTRPAPGDATRQRIELVLDRSTIKRLDLFRIVRDLPNRSTAASALLTASLNALDKTPTDNDNESDDQ